MREKGTKPGTIENVFIDRTTHDEIAVVSFFSVTTRCLFAHKTINPTTNRSRDLSDDKGIENALGTMEKTTFLPLFNNPACVILKLVKNTVCTAFLFFSLRDRTVVGIHKQEVI